MKMQILVPTVSFWGHFTRFYAAWVHETADPCTHAAFVEMRGIIIFSEEGSTGGAKRCLQSKSRL